jgi:hypothetical protein
MSWRSNHNFYRTFYDGNARIDEDIHPLHDRAILSIYHLVNDWVEGKGIRDCLFVDVDTDSQRRVDHIEFTVRIGNAIGIEQRVDIQTLNEWWEEIAERIIDALNQHLRQIRRTGTRQPLDYNWARMPIEPPRSVLDRRLTWFHDESQLNWVNGLRVCAADETNEKAKELLLSCLTPEQESDYLESNSFVAIGNETGTSYRINRGRQINIVKLDSDYRPVMKLCTVSVERIPVEDHMLAQKLMIETEEDAFLKKAIKWEL